MISSFIKKHNLPIFLLLLISFIYLHNLSRSVFGGDVGDFVTSAIVMGVPHPSGYPLITFLGFLLTRIHFLTPAFMVGLISVFSSSIAVVLFYLFSFELTKNRFIALLSALVLAFNYLFWFYAEIAEVFALNNLFVVLLIFLAYMYFKYKKIKFLYLLALFTGLSMTNNYTISFIFPSLAILVFSNYKEFLKKPKIILQCFLLALLGFSVVLYIPIASFFNPPINWGNVKDISSFLDVLFRKYYGTFSVGLTPDLTLFQKIVIQKNYFQAIFYQLTIPVIFFCILGSVSLLKKNKLLFSVLLLAFLLSGPVFIALINLPLLNSFYIGVYERFYTMSAVLLLFFFPFGLQFFILSLNKVFKKNTYEKLFIMVFFIIPLLLFKYNFNKTDLHNVWVGDNLVYDIISPLPPNSILILTRDTPLFNSWYVHYGLKFRPDVYFISLVANDSLHKFTNEYLKEFPEDSKDRDLVAKALLNASTKTPVFSNLKFQSSKGRQLIWIPYGLVYKLENDPMKILPKQEFLKTQSKIWNTFKNKDIEKLDYLGVNSLTISEIASAYSNALIEQGNFLFNQYRDSKLALSYFQRAIELDIFNQNAYLALATFQMSNLNCSKALDNLDKAMELNPLSNKTYYLLYINYKLCFKDTKKSEDVVKRYNTVFRGNFFKDLKVNDIKIDI